jgi:hypothetical protein
MAFATRARCVCYGKFRTESGRFGPDNRFESRESVEDMAQRFPPVVVAGVFPSALVDAMVHFRQKFSLHLPMAPTNPSDYMKNELVQPNGGPCPGSNVGVRDGHSTATQLEQQRNAPPSESSSRQSSARYHHRLGSRATSSNYIDRSPPAFVTAGVAATGPRREADVSPLHGEKDMTPSPRLAGGSFGNPVTLYSPETSIINHVMSQEQPSPATLSALMKQKEQQRMHGGDDLSVEDDDSSAQMDIEDWCGDGLEDESDAGHREYNNLLSVAASHFGQLATDKEAAQISDVTAMSWDTTIRKEEPLPMAAAVAGARAAAIAGYAMADSGKSFCFSLRCRQSLLSTLFLNFVCSFQIIR